MMEESDTAIFCVKTGQKTSSERVPNLEIRIMNHDLLEFCYVKIEFQKFHCSSTLSFVLKEFLQ